MAEPILIAEEIELNTEIEPSNKSSRQPSDSSGFGLVNWLFDHIDERKPIFLCLYQEYDREVKLSSSHKIINAILLFFVLVGDSVLFLIYAGAVILIIIGITFIFVKGTGLLDFIK